MRRVFNTLYLIFSFIFIGYLLIPQPGYPNPLRDSIQSDEPADVESPLRRGYYSQLGRAEVIEHYKYSFDLKNLYGFIFQYPFVRLNYPPEESQTLIRDQTRSTYLEEIVHPLRESIFINGFEPKLDKDVIIKNGIQYRQKVIVKYYQSNVFSRLFVGFGIILILYYTISYYFEFLKDSQLTLKKNHD